MPSALLVRTCVSLVPVSVRVRLAPALTSPSGSVTTPWMEVRNCANAGELRHKDITANAQIARTLEILLFISASKKAADFYYQMHDLSSSLCFVFTIVCLR